MSHMKPARMWVEIVCDCCARTTAGRFVRGGRIPIREMTAEVVKAGWRQKTSGDYECGKCTKEALDALNAEIAMAYPEVKR